MVSVHALYLGRLYFTRLRVRVTVVIFYAHVSILIPFVTTPPCLWPLFLSASSPHSSQGEPFSSDSAHTLPVASQDSGNQHKVLTMALEALHNVALLSFPT